MVHEGEVGTYRDLQTRSETGDGLDLHHMPQFRPANDLNPDLSYNKAVAIVIARNRHIEFHRISPTYKSGEYDGNARQLLAENIRTGRRVNISNKSLQQIIQQNKEMFPDMYAKDVIQPQSMNASHLNSFISGTPLTRSLVGNSTIHITNYMLGKEDISLTMLRNIGYETTMDVVDTYGSRIFSDIFDNASVVGGRLYGTFSPTGIMVNSVGAIGSVNSCYKAEFNYLHDNNIFDARNASRAMSQCARANVADLIPGNNLVTTIGKSAYRTINSIDRDLYDHSPIDQRTYSYLDKFNNKMYENMVSPMVTVTGTISDGVSALSRPITFGKEHIYDPLVEYMYRESNSSNGVASEIDKDDSYYNSTSNLDNNLNIDDGNVSYSDVNNTDFDTNSYFDNQMDNSNIVSNNYDSPKQDLDDAIADFKESYEFIENKDGDIIVIEKEKLQDLYDEIGIVEEGTSIQNAFESLSSKLEKFQQSLADKYPKTTKFIEKLGKLQTVVSGLDIIVNFKKMSVIQRISSIGNFVINNFTNLANNIKTGFGNFVNLATKFIETGKLRLENLVGAVMQCKFGIPTDGFFQVINSISHHGQNLGKSIMSLAIDIVTFLNPYAKAINIIFNIGKTVLSFFHKNYNKKIKGFEANVDESVKVKFWKMKIENKVRMYNEILDIDVSSSSKHKSNARDECERMFMEEVKVKAYQVFGRPAYLFDPEYKSPDGRLDKLRESCLIANLEKTWKEINNMTDEQIELYNNVNQSSEDKDKRIEYEILEKKLSKYSKDKHKNVIKFSQEVIDDFRGCENMTEVAEKIYSLAYDTGRKEGKKLVFSDKMCYILKLFNIDPDKLAEYINHQKVYSDDELKKQIDTKKKEEEEQYVKMVVDKRDERKKEQSKNDELNNNQNTNLIEYKKKMGLYSNEEMMNYIHQKIMEVNLSMEVLVTTGFSTGVGLIVGGIAYIDIEIRQMYERKALYFYDKIKYFASSYLQSWTTSSVTRHLVATIKYHPNLQHLTDELIDNYIAPNVGMMVGLGVSFVNSFLTPFDKTKSTCEKVYDIVDNAIKTNIKVINDFLISKFVMYKSFITYISSLCVGLSTGATGVLLPGVVLALVTRVVKDVFFSHKKKEMESYDLTPKIMSEDQYNYLLSRSNGLERSAIMHEMVKYGFIKPAPRFTTKNVGISAELPKKYYEQKAQRKPYHRVENNQPIKLGKKVKNKVKENEPSMIVNLGKPKRNVKLSKTNITNDKPNDQNKIKNTGSNIKPSPNKIKKIDSESFTKKILEPNMIVNFGKPKKIIKPVKENIVQLPQ